jgi:glycosyltransferase involved in cell wall biosynthesis
MMKEQRGILVVVPAYNEAPHIAQVVTGIRRSVPSADILVVDDASSDDTRQLALQAGARVITLPINLGDGGARHTGFKYASLKGYRLVVQMDGDGQHDPDDIGVLLQALVPGEADLVIGSRFVEPTDYRTPKTRRLGMLFFSKIASWIIGQEITDPTSGFRAMNRKVAAFYATDVYPNQYPDADVLIMTHLAGFRLKEVPVAMRQDRTGKTIHAGLRPVYYVYKMLLSILVTLLRGRQDLPTEVKDAR